MAEAGVDSFWIAHPANVRYLCGFTGSNGIGLLTSDAFLLGTDGRYVTQCADECEDVELVVDRDTVRGLAARAQGNVAIEADYVTVNQLSIIAERVTTTPVSGWVEGVRVVKDSAEEAFIREACQISDDALESVLPQIRLGMTELEIARALEREMLERGAEGLAFDSIVAGGPNSAIPHHKPTVRPLESGDFLKIDFGARVAGYHADQTRTFVLGSPAPWQLEIHAVVAHAQACGREALSDGVNLAAVDEASRKVIAAAGYAENYPHGLGHGVGLEIHEAPMLGARSTGILHAGVPVTIEPGIYLPGRGGVRIEDTMWVTESGSESLTRLPRELLVL
jgi:Xaa-Pro dipeptidase